MKAQLAKAQALLNLKNPKTDEAMKLLQPMVNKKNAPWPVYHFSGIAFVQKGDYETALSFLNEALKQGSDVPETHHAISICYFNMANYEQAEEHANKALKKNPEFFKGWLHLGSLYRAQAKLDEALKCFQKANQIDPTSAGVAFRIGEIYNDQGALNKALELFNITLKIDKEYLQAYLAKAEILKKQNNYREAEDTIYEVLSQQPRNVAAKVSLAELYKFEGNYKKAIELYERLIEQYPNLAGARINYALCMQELGNFEESESNYLRAFKDAPKEFEALSNYLMSVHYNPERTKQEIFDAHMLWDKNFAPAERPIRPIPFDSTEDKRLRVGFLSGGFRTHPVGWMITKALENLPKDQFEIYCYTTHNRFDQVTKRIHKASDKWQSVIGYNDEVIARMIRDDEIDILVELSGHAADTRLKTVVLEPAPVIVKWVGGLFNTTGLESVDYLITDHQETPKGEEEFYTEKLVRMPDDYICFMPPEYAPAVAGLPAKEKGYVTFGCFNNPTKVNDQILEKWAEIMKRVPNSRLFLKSKQYDTAVLRDRIIETMKSCGITEDRLIFEGQSQHDGLLEKYNEVDIALDPWPYSGGLTTCEALWMGTPVITKPGPTFAGRHSATHLHNAGLSEWITDSWEEYIEKTVELASDLDALADFRTGLRDQIANSPVCDGPRFGAHLSNAFREMWKQRLKGYEENVPEGQWQDHIDIASIAEDEIQRGAERRDAMEQVNEIEDDFIRQGIKEVVEESQAHANGHTNGSSNGHVAPQNGTAGNAPETPEIYHIETKDGVTICTPPDLEMMTPYVLLEQNDWYEYELDFIRDYLKAGMNMVDVGAGFGVYSLPAAKQVGAEGTVFCFEPGTVAKNHLEKSKLKNGFENLEIIGKAVSELSGKQNWKVAKTPELNKLDESGEEEMAVTTLDSWWEFEGRPRIDVLKVDVNGSEAGVLKGALELLSSELPVLLISITEQKANVFAAELKERGYALYEYIPGPKILAEYNIEAGTDPYMQNVIALPESRTKDFKKAGWLHDETAMPGEIKADLWKTALGELPWTETLMEQWSNHSNAPEIVHYLQALNYLITAENLDANTAENPQTRSLKAGLQLGAAQILIQLYNQGANSTSVVFTLVRALNALGKRGQAVEVMQKLIETTKLGQENMNVDLPFMLPIPDQDNAAIKTELPKWLMVRTVEAWILLKDLTTYLSGPQERKLLEVLEGNPEVMARLSDVKKKITTERDNGVSKGVHKASKARPNIVHLCFNHVFAQSLSDLIEHVNNHSDQQHRLYIEAHRAIPNYSVGIDNNPASTLFNFQKNLAIIAKECLKEEVDMVMFHGIFFDWQKKLIHAIGDKKHIGWIIWGGDLYNPIKTNTRAGFPDQYIDSIHSSFKGDRTLYNQHYQEKPEFDFVYPIPGLYGKVEVNNNNSGGRKRIIVGNSGDESNEHISILKQLAAKEDIADYEIVLPVAYNLSEGYKRKLVQTIQSLKFENSVVFHTEFIAPTEYLNFLAGADMIITAHNRQQSMGNLIMSLYLNKPSFLRSTIEINGEEKENPGWGFLVENGLQPLDYQSFAAYKNLSDVPKPSTNDVEEYQHTFLQKFGLENRAKLLTASCSQIIRR